jgi:2-C-methyl-D-erythritol 4-phosphate cytidylyltransferase
LKAYQKAIDENLSGMDDAELVSSLGTEVYVVHGHKNNIKITTPIDLLLAEKIWESDVEEYA